MWSPEHFKRMRKKLGLSQSELAVAFNVASDRTVRRWEEGERDIPGPVIVLMELCLKFGSVREYLGIETEDGAVD